MFLKKSAHFLFATGVMHQMEELSRPDSLASISPKKSLSVAGAAVVDDQPSTSSSAADMELTVAAATAGISDKPASPTPQM